MEFIDASGERLAVFHAGFIAQVRRAHLPLPAKHAQDRLGVPAQSPLLLRSAHPPDGVKVGDHARGEEHGFAAGEFGIVDPAAPHELVLQPPRERGLGVFLYVAWHHGVAAPTDCHVERRAWSPGIGQAGGEADLLDEAFRVEGGLDLPRPFAAPAFIAVLFNLRWNLWLGESLSMTQQVRSTSNGRFDPTLRAQGD
ncbi:MAG: hypothetical protein AUH43_07385 [Acidobacteria bacterium 13_1_40CM_65_14]|nr:MAG: hypothetical protein AUH43_07385 [Acidobacteria bacterium 13_1_40CM_65_14]